MTSFRVEPGVLASSGTTLAPASSSLAGISVALPAPSMYGQIVGASAAYAEPHTTQQLNDLIQALSELYTSIAERLKSSAQCYTDTEDKQIQLVGHVKGMLQ